MTDGTNALPGKFALKALAAGKPAKAYERFARELDSLKKLNHPSIVKVVDHAEPTSPFKFYVMELIDGAQPLKKTLLSDSNQFKNNPRLAVGLFIDLVEAIAHCWENKIVHRDLSLGNVLILRSGGIKLIDFGICQTEGEETITLIDEGVGTQNYMAPECESGAAGDVTWKSDLYSAGKILWSAVTGQMAFSRESAAYNAKSMQKLLPDSPSAWHLHHLFEKSIRHDPEKRFKEPSEALAAARQVLFLITAGYPPIELLNETCPTCGWGKLGSFDGSHMVFGNPPPRGVRAVKCNYCGFCFAQDMPTLNENISRRTFLA
ncbi:MAG: serine/threonine protein kinase [Planctomycetes bacterium]|nr:serine/threonine protein kinase [Planctomycetota bacterium]